MISNKNKMKNYNATVLEVYKGGMCSIQIDGYENWSALLLLTTTTGYSTQCGRMLYSTQHLQNERINVKILRRNEEKKTLDAILTA